MQAGELNAETELVGGAGQATATFIQTGGVNAVNRGGGRTGTLSVDHVGTYELQGGQLLASIENIGVSANTTARFLQTGGVNRLDFNDAGLGFLFVDHGGSYRLNVPAVPEDDPAAGADHLRATRQSIGVDAQGEFLHDSGNNRVTETLSIGTNVAGAGLYHLASGALTATNVYVGESATGAGSPSGFGGWFRHLGGMNSVVDLWVGKNTDSKGYYELAGTGFVTAAYVNIGARSKFEQSGGQVEVASKEDSYLYLHPGVPSGAGGWYHIRAGRLAAQYEWIDGYFTQTGGTNGAVVVGIGMTGEHAGQYSLDGGTLSANLVHVGPLSRFRYFGGLLVADVRNDGAFEVVAEREPLLIIGDFENNGEFEHTGYAPIIIGSYSGDGGFQAHSNSNYFRDVSIGETGYFSGAEGSRFHVSGDFTNLSSASSEWDTTRATLVLEPISSPAVP